MYKGLVKNLEVTSTTTTVWFILSWMFYIYQCALSSDLEARSSINCRNSWWRIKSQPLPYLTDLNHRTRFVLFACEWKSDLMWAILLGFDLVTTFKVKVCRYLLRNCVLFWSSIIGFIHNFFIHWHPKTRSFKPYDEMKFILSSRKGLLNRKSLFCI